MCGVLLHELIYVPKLNHTNTNMIFQFKKISAFFGMDIRKTLNIFID